MKMTVKERQIKSLGDNLESIKDLNKVENLPSICEALGIRYKDSRTILKEIYDYDVIKHSYNKGESLYNEIYEKHKDEFERLIKEGNSLLDICDQYGFGDIYPSLYKMIRRDSPDLLTRQKSDIVRKRLSKSKMKRDKFEKEIVDLYVEGKSSHEIVKEIGNELSAATVLKTVRDYHIPLNDPKIYWNEERRCHFKEMGKSGKIGILGQTHHGKRKTQPEQEFADWCDDNLIPYEFQYTLKPLGHRYDFYLPDYHLLVEIDGVFWHSGPEKIERDNNFMREAEEMGYQVIRFTDKEINKTKSKCFEVINDIGQHDRRRTDIFEVRDKTKDFTA